MEVFKLKILFSVLRYQLITDEFMNIGILFHNLDTDERRLETISKWTRLKGFDDELDLKIFKILLDGIKEEIQNTLFNKKQIFDIYEYHKRYVNELRFSEIYTAEVDDFNEYIEFSKKNFLRYDYEKKERPGINQQLRYMKSLMKGNSIEYSSKPILGKFSENIKFDYIINEFAFKIFSFEEKKLSQMISTAKFWAYTAYELKDKYKVIFLYDKDVIDENFNIIKNILEDSSFKVIRYDEGLNWITKLSKDKNKLEGIS
ncbi:DUF3037 domain-containing protein [Clostridium perfringens]